MKVLGINGSQRKDGSSYHLLKWAFEGVIEGEGRMDF